MIMRQLNLNLTDKLNFLVYAFDMSYIIGVIAVTKIIVIVGQREE